MAACGGSSTRGNPSIAAGGSAGMTRLSARVGISGGDKVYPKNCNYCFQLYPKLQKCVSHVYPKILFIRAQCPRPSFPRHDEAIIFEAASYSSRYASMYPRGLFLGSRFFFC